MAIQTLKLFRIDRFDGGDRHRPSPFHFKDEGIAKTAAGPHDSISPVTLVICETVDDMEAANKELEIVTALEKLTPAQRELLGYPRDTNLAIQEAILRNKS